ncbi:hypothetical protein [Actinospica robiniae]|uniref:hypothetical protein n=1 Tax=Actinospica robiniae TaxID=304901 RepID=UPI0004261415|nr:hypothetical protein [Actinospica robiniae]
MARFADWASTVRVRVSVERFEASGGGSIAPGPTEATRSQPPYPRSVESPGTCGRFRSAPLVGAVVSATHGPALVTGAREVSVCGVKVEEYLTCGAPPARWVETPEEWLVLDTTGADVCTTGLDVEGPVLLPATTVVPTIGWVGTPWVRPGVAAAAGVAGPTSVISTVAMPAAAVSEAIGASRRRRTGRAMRSERGTGGMDFRVGDGGIGGCTGPAPGRRSWRSAFLHGSGLYEDRRVSDAVG